MSQERFDRIIAALGPPFYSDGRRAIYVGDCREMLPKIEPGSLDLVLTDPPYEMVAKGGGICSRRDYMRSIEGFTDGGFDIDLLRQFPNWACFCAKAQLPALIALASAGRWMLVTWNKPNPTPLTNANYLPDTEYIVHAFQPNRLFGDYRDKARFIVHPVEKNGFDHPNVKPLPVVSKMIRLGTEYGDLILDPFLGSGTTLRAAKDLDRYAVGIEIEQNYAEVAKKRLRQSVLEFST